MLPVELLIGTGQIADTTLTSRLLAIRMERIETLCSCHGASQG
jgi:hypothetical protein